VIAQLVLTGLLGIVVLYAWIAYQQSRVVGVAAVGAAVAGLYFVWIPAHAMILAEWAGVGRGVDLIIYVWVVISLIIMLNLHLKIRSHAKRMTELARKVAISGVSVPRCEDEVAKRE
jgi:hypothetical protein